MIYMTFHGDYVDITALALLTGEFLEPVLDAGDVEYLPSVSGAEDYMIVYK